MYPRWLSVIRDQKSKPILLENKPEVSEDATVQQLAHNCQGNGIRPRESAGYGDHSCLFGCRRSSHRRRLQPRHLLRFLCCLRRCHCCRHHLSSLVMSKSDDGSLVVYVIR
ncbi:hypothetical protein BS78_07G066400 [Paspalum vaginatum]|nr:hypothetical protein BS78_07G066400 [Paspalum vaginatum]